MTVLIVSFHTLLNDSVSYPGTCTTLWTPLFWSQSILSRTDFLPDNTSGEFKKSSPAGEGRNAYSGSIETGCCPCLETTINLVNLRIWGMGKQQAFLVLSQPFPSPSIG